MCRSKVCEKVIEKKGELHQLGILQEEAAELIQIISKVRRGLKNPEDIAEEMADVYIVWSQIYLLRKNEIDAEIKRKIRRLADNLDNL